MEEHGNKEAFPNKKYTFLYYPQGVENGRKKAYQKVVADIFLPYYQKVDWHFITIPKVLRGRGHVPQKRYKIMTGAKVGYLRVSTSDQNEARQLDGLKLDKTFSDKRSGLARERPGFKDCLEYLREGDSLYIHSLDRLGRFLFDILSIVKELSAKGITVHFVQERISFTPEANNPVMELSFHLLAAFSEFERKRIKERQREGIRAAKNRGVKLGRKPHFSEPEKEEIRNRHRAGVSKAQLAKDCGVSLPTIYRIIPPQGK